MWRPLDSICFAPQWTKPFYSDLVVKVNVISVAKLMENILKDDPGIVSLQLDGWIANHYGYAGLLINDATLHWCVFSVVF